MRMQSLHDITEWEPQAIGNLAVPFGLTKIFERLEIGAHAEALFGEPPRAYLHKGDLNINGSELVDGGGFGVFVLDGSLHVQGTFTFSSYDAYTVLVVTGDVYAANFQQLHDTQVVVFGNVVIDGSLRIDISDAGFTVFKGSVKAKDILFRQGVDGAIQLYGEKRSDRVIEPDEVDPWSAEVMQLMKSGGAILQRIHLHVASGGALFAPPDTKPRKVLSKGELAKMTPDEFLAVARGFRCAQLDGALVNPNYLTKGKPGQVLEELTILDNAVVTTFPENTHGLKRLTVLNPSVAAQAAIATLLDSIHLLRDLRYLRLAETELTSLPSGIRQLSKIEVLSIYSNKRITSLPPWLGDMVHLKELIISDNSLTSLPKELSKLSSTTVRIDEADIGIPEGGASGSSR